MDEAYYQNYLKKKINYIFAPNCYVLKNDPRNNQGFPDLIVLCNDKYAILEVKRNKMARKRPNQAWYIERFKKEFNVFSSFIYPENEEEVLEKMEEYFYGV